VAGGRPVGTDTLLDPRLTAAPVRYESVRHAGLAYFALKHQPPGQRSFLVLLGDLDDLSDERVLVDPGQIDDSGQVTIDWYEPSPDGSLVAVSVSSHASGSLAWAGDCSGFWCTRYPSPGQHPDGDDDFYQEVWYHRLGGSLAGDRRELAGVFADNKIAENFLTASPDGRWVMDRGALYLLSRLDAPTREGSAAAAAGRGNRRTRCRGGTRGGCHDRGQRRGLAAGGDRQMAVAAGHGRRHVVAEAVQPARQAGRAGRGAAGLRGRRPGQAGRD
jgi:hypothetical protein